MKSRSIIRTSVLAIILLCSSGQIKTSVGFAVGVGPGGPGVGISVGTPGYYTDGYYGRRYRPVGYYGRTRYARYGYPYGYSRYGHRHGHPYRRGYTVGLGYRSGYHGSHRR